MARFNACGSKAAVFYPMGWDDDDTLPNAASELLRGALHDPSLPYDPDFTPPHTGGEGKSIKARDQVLSLSSQLRRAVRATHG